MFFCLQFLIIENFYLQKVEAKEREDELASIEHGVQGGGSGKKSRGKKKGGKKLVVKEETFPSVDGEYCEVVIDEAIKKRIADADKRNKKVVCINFTFNFN